MMHFITKATPISNIESKLRMYVYDKINDLVLLASKLCTYIYWRYVRNAITIISICINH